jgi:hypothetical protein
MTRITALIIISNYPDNILIESCKCKNGKFSGLLYLLRNSIAHTLLISTNDIFESDEDAKTALHDYVKELQKTFEDGNREEATVLE